MYKFINDPITKLVIFCVALSAGLWVWSKHLPEPTWESTLAVTPPPKTAETASAPGSENKLPAAIPTPTDTVAASPEPKSVAPEISAPASETPAPAPDIAASAAPAPSTDTASVAPSASAEPAAPLPSPTAAPSDATLAGPLPQNPAPESASTPAPEAASPPPAAAIVPPAAMEIADIAKQPSLWPKQIVILVPVRFPVVLNGVNIGNIQVPPHSAVVLQKVNPDGTVTIERQGSQAKVKAQETDLSARVALAQEKSTPSLPDAVPVPATASLPAASVPAP